MCGRAVGLQKKLCCLFSPFVCRFFPCFKTLRINVCYWSEKVPGSYSVSQTFPCFMCLDSDPYHVYGLPGGEYPGLMKVSRKAEQRWLLEFALLTQTPPVPVGRSRVRFTVYSLFFVCRENPLSCPKAQLEESFLCKHGGAGADIRQ